MRIVITNAYTWYNKGDAGILLATIDVLKKIYNNPEFYILSFSPEEDSKRYCKDKSIKNVESNILNPHPYKHTKFGKIMAIVKLFIKMLILQFNIKFNFKRFVNNNSTLSLLKNSDLIIVCGGGFLGGKKVDSLMHVYQIYINTLFKKPVYILGTSIEPMKNKLVKKYTEKVLKKVDYIFAREEITDEYLSHLLPKEKHCLIPDMAFMLNDEKKEYEFLNKYKEKSDYVFGITVRKWNFPNMSNSSRAMERYLESIRDMMEYYINKYNAYFIFIPQVIVDTGDDTLTAQKIKDMLSEDKKDNFIIRREDWSPYEIKAIIGNFNYFIGTRMHSNIFATSMLIPTVAIAYEKKTNGIMKTLELEDYIVEIDTITSNELITKIDKMVANNIKIKKHLAKKIADIRKNIYQKVADNLMKTK